MSILDELEELTMYDVRTFYTGRSRPVLTTGCEKPGIGSYETALKASRKAAIVRQRKRWAAMRQRNDDP